MKFLIFLISFIIAIININAHCVFETSNGVMRNVENNAGCFDMCFQVRGTGGQCNANNFCICFPPEVSTRNMKCPYRKRDLQIIDVFDTPGCNNQCNRDGRGNGRCRWRRCRCDNGFPAAAA